LTNFDLIEKNETSNASRGGTEIFLEGLYGGTIPRDLLENFQIIPSRVRDLKEDKIRILSVHDLPNDPEAQKLQDANFRKNFHKIVYISDWQYQQYMNFLQIPYSHQNTVIESCIQPSSVNWFRKPKDQINLCYTSTPQRGLNLVVPVVDALVKKYPNIHLHVHSSFKIYGWEDRDASFEPLYEQIRNHPNMTYHGFTSHEDLLELLPTYHIHAYPCIWPETSCRSMLEAMSAGVLCVHPNYAALPETSGALNLMYQGDQDANLHANLFAGALISAIEMVNTWDQDLVGRLQYNKQYVDYRFAETKIHTQWLYLLKELLQRYDTVEKRALPTEMFSYNR